MIKLNLLPPEYRADIEYSKKNAKLYQYLIKVVAGLFAIGAFMGVVGYFVWANQTIAQNSRDDAYTQVGKFTAVESNATDFSTRLNLIEKLRADRFNWTKIFAEISKSTPANVRLVNVDFTNTGTDRVTLVGFALSNADIGSFRELLSQSSLFQYVDIESVTAGNDPSNTNRAGVNFKITLNLKAAEAKK